MNNHIKSYGEFIDPLYEAKLVQGIYKIWPNIDEADLSKAQKNYQELMTVGLLKFGAKTPSDLNKETKKEFFNWISSNWDKNKEEASKEAQELIKKAKDKKLFKPAEGENNPTQKDSIKAKDAKKELK